MMIKAVLFDMDGVLFDSEGVHFIAEKKVIEEHGYKPTKEQYKSMIGQPFVDSLSKVIKVKEDPEILFQKKMEIYLSMIDKIHPFMDTIGFIKNTTLKVGLVTSSRRIYANKLLNHFGIMKHFDIIVTIDDISNPKPHPEPYTLALSRLGVNKDECFAVEDSIPGIKSINAAGIFSVGRVGSLKREELAEANLIVDEVSQDIITKFDNQ